VGVKGRGEVGRRSLIMDAQEAGTELTLLVTTITMVELLVLTLIVKGLPKSHGLNSRTAGLGNRRKELKSEVWSRILGRLTKSLTFLTSFRFCGNVVDNLDLQSSLEVCGRHDQAVILRNRVRHGGAVKDPLRRLAGS
jgi:hypothetical protein